MKLPAGPMRLWLLLGMLVNAGGLTTLLDQGLAHLLPHLWPQTLR